MYHEIIETTVCGIPAQIGVVHFMEVKPSFRGDSDLDYYGYSECDWDVLDRKGYKAPWLEKKLTDKERDRIEDKIYEVMRGRLR